MLYTSIGFCSWYICRSKPRKAHYKYKRNMPFDNQKKAQWNSKCFCYCLWLFIPCLASRSMNHPCITAPQGIVTLRAQVACRILSAEPQTNPCRGIKSIESAHLLAQHQKQSVDKKITKAKKNVVEWSRESQLRAVEKTGASWFHLKVSGPERILYQSPRLSLPQKRRTELLGNARG